MSVCTYLWFLE